MSAPDRPRGSLSRTILAVVAALAALAIVVAMAMVYLTAAVHSSSEAIESSVESVKAAEEIARDLLLHELTTDPRARAQLSADIDAGLAEVSGYVGSEAEARALRAAREQVDVYLRAEDAPGRARAFALAHGAVGKLVDVNLEDARQERRRAAAYDRFSAGLAGVSTLLLAGMVAAVAWWLERRAFRPVLEVAEAVERFKSGDRDARAPTSGPVELAEMARRFNDLAASEAQQRQARMAFLAGIAHDLRNPLSALKCSRGVIHPDRPLPSEAHVRKAFELVQRQVERMDRLVSDFLDTARIEAGQLELREAPRDLREITRSACALFEATSGRHAIVLEEPAEPVVAACDGQRLEQVLDNLVGNAIKYSPDGGTVRVRVQREGAQAVISVSDQGMGIAAGDLQRVFEPFQRTEAARAAAPGMGLGLFVARRIVEGHGGALRVESRPGAGTTVEVRLPA